MSRKHNSSADLKRRSLNFELDDETTTKALFEYLEATNRIDIFGKDVPVRLRHDKGAKTAKKERLDFTRFCPAHRNLRSGSRNRRHRYSPFAAHLRQNRVEIHGHSNIQTTQIYVQRMAVKKDKHSKSIRDALEK
jgi:hypothetical protein